MLLRQSGRSRQLLRRGLYVYRPQLRYSDLDPAAQGKSWWKGPGQDRGAW